MKGDIVNVQAVVSFEYIASPGCLTQPLTVYERHAEHQEKMDLERLERDGAEIVYRPADRHNGARSVKAMIRRPIRNAKGVTLGKRQRATGYFYYGGYDDQSTLAQDKRHWVVVVQPLEPEAYYVESWLCLEEDLEATDELRQL